MSGDFLSEDERREHFRIEAALPLRHEPVSDEQLELVRMRIQSCSGEGETQPGRSGLVEWLLRLEQKLDLVLSLLDPDAPRPLGDRDVRLLELSGAGARYPWPVQVEEQQNLLLELVLPSSPPRFVRCLAGVVSCTSSPEHGGYYVAVRFVYIDESDRDAIIRYNLQLQRRRRSNGQEDTSE